MRRRNRIKKQWIVLIFLAVVIGLGIIYNTVNDKRSLTKIEGLIKDTGLFVNKIVYSPIELVKKKIVENREKQEMYDKYQELKNKSNNYDLLEAKKEELEFQLKEMQKILNLNNTLNKESYLNATVINRNVGIWYDAITIDKGSKNGIKVDMPVIVNEGLIGKITKVSNFNSAVKLLTSDEITDKISVKIKNNNDYILGLLVNYDLSNKVFIVEGIDQNTDIKEGSVVTTTGLGDYFPSGIIVGKVKQVRTDNFDLAKIVEVKSDVDFNKINYVTVLKREVIEE
jgi:rod shape-determining protein MreC